jgi:hypothetical protein
MLQIIDDTTDAQGVTTFEFNDGTTMKAKQNHDVAGVPFIPLSVATALQCNLVMGWSGCACHRV